MMKIEIKIENGSPAGEVVVTADKEGLEYLAEVCVRLIGKTGLTAHWHLSSDMGTLTKGSINAIIAFQTETGSA